MGVHSDKKEDKGNYCDWWWRRLKSAHFVDPDVDRETSTNHYETVWNEELCSGFEPTFNCWKRGQEVAAFRYELLRRVFLSKGLPSFPNIGCFLESRILGELKGPSYLGPLVFSSPVITDANWSDPLLRFQVDLTAPDNTIKNHFIAVVNSERIKKGVPIPKEKHKGRRNRPISWRVIENWDIKRLESNRKSIVFPVYWRKNHIDPYLGKFEELICDSEESRLLCVPIENPDCSIKRFVNDSQ